MWNRIRRIFRSLFGWLIRGAEDPELILRQLRDDMREKIPEFNNQVAEIVKHEKMLGMQLERQTEKVERLRPQVEAAVKLGPERKEAAKTLIMQLQQAESEIADTQAALERAKQNSQRMLKMRNAYVARTRQQMQEAMHQVDRNKQAQAESEMAEIMASFETGDEVDTLEQMTDQIDERLARAEARMEVAQTSVDSQLIEIEQAAEVDAAELAYEEYQRQLGLVPDTAAEPKTMASAEEEEQTEEQPHVLEQEEVSDDGNWGQPRQ